MLFASPRSEIARSQLNGCCTKAIAGIETTSYPTKIGSITPLTRPMSWNCGSHVTIGGGQRSSNSPAREQLRRISARLCSTFACVSATPLGVPVEPDEYCR